MSAIYYGAELGWHPLAVGAVVAAGQGPMYVLLYLGGDRWILRWKRLARMVERTRTRHAAHLERNYMAVTAMAAMLGVPPVIAMCAMAAAFDVRLTRLLPVVVAGRVLRFTALASGGTFTS